jgi:integrase
LHIATYYCYNLLAKLLAKTKQLTLLRNRMGRNIKKFTDKQIQALKPETKPYLVAESNPEGFALYLRIRPSGRKAFLAVYWKDGKRRWLTIGRYPAITLVDARQKCKDIHQLAAKGGDPTQAKHDDKVERINAPTVTDFAETYLKKHAEPKKKSAKEDRRILEVYVLPKIGHRKLKDVSRAEIIHLLDDVAERGPIMANRTLAAIRKMFNFAIDRSVLDSTPCQNIIPPGKETKKERFLSEEEIKTLWSKMDEKLTDQTNRAIKVILATGQRPGEVASMDWGEIDGRWWTIPSEKTKNGTPHRLYLNSIAIQLIGKPQKNGFVFPSRAKGKSIHPNAFGHALRSKMKNFEVEHFTAHDLRRTAATHMAKLGHGLSVGKILNHTEHSVTAIYDRYSYDKEKRAALIAWSKKLTLLIEDTPESNVIQLKR